MIQRCQPLRQPVPETVTIGPLYFWDNGVSSFFMRGTFRFQNPDALEATITLTAPVGEWKALKALLADKWPAWDVGLLLSDLISRAERTHEVKSE